MAGGIFAAFLIAVGGMLHFVGLRIAIEARPELARAMGGVLTQAEQDKIEESYKERLRLVQDQTLDLIFLGNGEDFGLLLFRLVSGFEFLEGFYFFLCQNTVPSLLQLAERMHRFGQVTSFLLDSCHARIPILHQWPRLNLLGDSQSSFENVTSCPPIYTK